jgi:hypothetical protein
MKKIIIFALLTITKMTISAQNFESHQWKNRLVLIISSDSNSEIFQKQLEELSTNRKGLKSRKLIIYKILPEKLQIPNKDSTWVYNSELHASYTKSGEPFKVILIGLDRGVKLEQNAVLTTEELFSKIDAMPMRQSELKNNN